MRAFGAPLRPRRRERRYRLFRDDRAFGGRLVKIAKETIAAGRERPQEDRDLGLARHDFLDPKRLAFNFFGRLRTTSVIGVLAGTLISAGWNRCSLMAVRAVTAS